MYSTQLNPAERKAAGNTQPRGRRGISNTTNHTTATEAAKVTTVTSSVMSQVATSNVKNNCKSELAKVVDSFVIPEKLPMDNNELAKVVDPFDIPEKLPMDNLVPAMKVLVAVFREKRAAFEKGSLSLDTSLKMNKVKEDDEKEAKLQNIIVDEEQIEMEGIVSESVDTSKIVVQLEIIKNDFERSKDALSKIEERVTKALNKLGAYACEHFQADKELRKNIIESWSNLSLASHRLDLEIRRFNIKYISIPRLIELEAEGKKKWADIRAFYYNPEMTDRVSYALWVNTTFKPQKKDELVGFANAERALYQASLRSLRKEKMGIRTQLKLFGDIKEYAKKLALSDPQQETKNIAAFESVRITAAAKNQDVFKLLQECWNNVKIQYDSVFAKIKQLELTIPKLNLLMPSETYAITYCEEEHKLKTFEIDEIVEDDVEIPANKTNTTESK